jgi:hypothetical protein
VRYDFRTGQFPNCPGPRGKAARRSYSAPLGGFVLTLDCQERHVPVKVERDTFASPQLTAESMPLHEVESAPVSGRRNSLMRTVYLAAIAVATLGWLWLIAWIARQLA